MFNECSQMKRINKLTEMIQEQIKQIKQIEYQQPYSLQEKEEFDLQNEQQLKIQEDSKEQKQSEQEIGNQQSDNQRQFTNPNEELTLQDEIKSYLLWIVSKNQCLPSIFRYLHITTSQISIKYSESIKQHLIEIYHPPFNSDLLPIQLLLEQQQENDNKMEEALILKILKIISHSITVNEFEQQEFRNFDLKRIKKCATKLKLIDKAILQQNKQIVKIVQQVSLIMFELQEIKTIRKNIKVQEGREEQLFTQVQTNTTIPIQSTNLQCITLTPDIMSDAILKIMLFKMMEFGVVFPEILKNLQFTTDGKRYGLNLNKEILVFKPSNALLFQILSIQKMKKIEQELNATSSTTQQIYQQLTTMFSEYNQFNLLEAQERMIGNMVERCTQYLEGFLTVFVDEQFRMLLSQIQSQCGTKIRLIIDLKVDEEEEYNKFGSNILKIGTMLNRIQQILKNHQPLHFSHLPRQKGLESRFSEDKKSMFREIYQMTNPLYKLFISKLISKSRAFPYFLRTLTVKKFDVAVRYRKCLITELLQFVRFTKFLSKEYGIRFDCQESLMERAKIVQQIDHSLKEEVKEMWPKLILKQLNLIYDQRETIKEELKEAVGSKNYQQMLKDLSRQEENNPDKKAVKEIIMDISYFVRLLD